LSPRLSRHLSLRLPGLANGVLITQAKALAGNITPATRPVTDHAQQNGQL
jgi:hypothetical protein